MFCVRYQMANKEVVLQAIKRVLKGACSIEMATGADGMFQCENNLWCVWSHNSIYKPALTYIFGVLKKHDSQAGPW
jgi:hypothetical protein